MASSSGPTLVTGGTGFLGAHLVRALVGRGERPRCLVRPTSDRRNLAGLPVEIVPGDLTDAASLRRATQGVATVFHCAADYRLYVRDPRETYANNVEGTRNVLRAAAEAGVSRVVYTSSVGALGLNRTGRPATEETPVALADMVGHYKRSKFLAERVAQEWSVQGLPLVIVNPSAPVGELDIKPTPTGQILVRFLNRRMPAYVETGLNLVDVRDVAEGHLLAAEKGRVGEKYILGHRNMTLKELLETLARLTGLPAPRLRVPHWIPLAVAAVDTSFARLVGRSPEIPIESVRLSRHRMFFDAGKAVRELGLPQTAIEDALERAVRWFRENGYVRPR
ncbi:MAG TPA: hopanoid-associated sugar epimerase [Vicinamibacteria bacterium]|nr:hopanoid-associated sugar epimerase [Vicinamibacteria bacterium]